LEILGYPRLEIKLSSDKPHAMLFASLLDVAPDGSASRVSYGVMNLTHLQGHDKVVLLTPGEKVKAFVELDCCGYRFAAGHRLRLSLATSCWPMFWPMPDDAALTLHLDDAQLIMPHFNGQDCKGPDMQPQSAPHTPVTYLKDGKVDRIASYDIVNDMWTCVTDGVGGVFGEGIYRFDDIDVTVEHNLKRELTLRNSDPLSAHYTIYQQLRMGRSDWQTDIDVVISQTCDYENFYIEGKMTAKEGNEIRFERQWEYKVKRNGL